MAFEQPEFRRITDIPRYWAKQQPLATALWEQGRRFSFSWLERAIARAADLLRARGVVQGDRPTCRQVIPQSPEVASKVATLGIRP